MTTLELQGRITETGVLEIQLPPGLPSGDVKVHIEIPDNSDWEERPWTEEELQELTKPQTMDEFVRWLQSHPAEEEWGELVENGDAAEYIHNLRRQRRSMLGE